MSDYDTWKLTAPDERGGYCVECGQPSGDEQTCDECAEAEEKEAGA